MDGLLNPKMIELLSAGGNLANIALVVIMWRLYQSIVRLDRRVIQLEVRQEILKGAIHEQKR